MIENREWDKANPEQKLDLLRRELGTVVPTIGDLWSRLRAQHGELVAEIKTLQSELQSLKQK